MIAMFRLAVVDEAGVPLSVTFTVNGDVPVPLGVLEITLLFAFKGRPLGKLPWVIDQV